MAEKIDLQAKDSDLESGEERNVSDTEEACGNSSEDHQNAAMKKRKRGKIWQNVLLEEDLSESLAKVSTTEPVKTSFVDLDAPVASVEESTSRAAAYQNNTKRGSKKPRSWKAPVIQLNAPSGSLVPNSVNASVSNPDHLTSSVRIGEKRKNTMKPKSKRKTPGHPGGNVTTYFSLYPDWDSEVKDDDRLDIAARKAVHQLKEKFNPSTITQIVMQIGNAETRRLLQMTKTIEQHGGMLTKDNKNRRSPGGVFITLFKSDAEKQLGKDAVKTLLAKPKEGFDKGRKAAKKARAKERRTERRQVKEISEKMIDSQVYTAEKVSPPKEANSVSTSEISPSEVQVMDTESSFNETVDQTKFV